MHDEDHDGRCTNCGEDELDGVNGSCYSCGWPLYHEGTNDE